MSHLVVSRLCQWPAAAAACLARCIQQRPTAISLPSSLSDETNIHTHTSNYIVIQSTETILAHNVF